MKRDDSFSSDAHLRLNWGEDTSPILEPRYEHEIVDHAVQYVRGNVHTNSLENFWSLLKRGIRGTYVSVEPFHLHRYLDEQTFRFNERKGTDASRFASALSSIAGKRLTYQQLTGATQQGGTPSDGVNRQGRGKRRRLSQS